MHLRTGLFLALFTLAGATWPTPQGWRAEAFNLPPRFAPKMRVQGREELRFPPRCFQPGTPRYFSYAYVWEVRREAKLSGKALRGALVAYYAGLYAAVGQGRQLPARKPAASVEIRAAKTPFVRHPGARAYTAVIRTYDGFSDGRAVRLNAEIVVLPAAGGRLRLVLIAVSPRPKKGAPWPELRRVLAAYPTEAAPASRSRPSQ